MVTRSEKSCCFPYPRRTGPGGVYALIDEKACVLTGRRRQVSRLGQRHPCLSYTLQRRKGTCQGCRSCLVTSPT